ncbi:peptidoglycan glycosyltransferase FtsW [Microbacterium sp. A93]|uniref:peptidoglycan glycosyltransferase FtsW n=1 Tax=unclassified Microbacterium TaxID=2609290 RepID=UPI003F423700
MTQASRPPRTESRGLAARVSLGRIFTPPSNEFLLIASTALLLTVFGIVMVISATSAKENGVMDTALKQTMFAAVGIPMMFLVSRLPISLLKNMAWPAIIAATVLQLLVFTPLGIEDAGNRNWIRIAGFTMQPSEFLKLALALWIAYVLLRKRALLGTWKHVFIPVVPMAVMVLATVMAGNDLGTSMVLVLITLGCLFFSGVKLRLFILPLLAGAGGILFYALSSADRMRRITALCANIDPAVDIETYRSNCYQSVHAVWGMANGGFFGLGLGNSQEKYGWLPAAANDFIFAIVGEELGLIGCIVVLGLFTFFAVGAFHIMRKTQDPFIRVASGGIAVWIIGQALINVGVVIGIFPVMGVPLPFMSQGGTALLAVLLACGVLLAFARTIPATERGKVTK